MNVRERERERGNVVLMNIGRSKEVLSQKKLSRYVLEGAWNARWECFTHGSVLWKQWVFQTSWCVFFGASRDHYICSSRHGVVQFCLKNLVNNIITWSIISHSCCYCRCVQCGPPRLLPLILLLQCRDSWFTGLSGFINSSLGSMSFTPDERGE